MNASFSSAAHCAVWTKSTNTHQRNKGTQWPEEDLNEIVMPVN